VLVTGSHQVLNLEKSKAYVTKVAKFWQEAGFEVSMRSSDPDSDFMFMTHAHHFIRSGGGFSETISAVVTHLGGAVH
jgi:hypothetical protein